MLALAEGACPQLRALSLELYESTYGKERPGWTLCPVIEALSAGGCPSLEFLHINCQGPIGSEAILT